MSPRRTGGEEIRADADPDTSPVTGQADSPVGPTDPTDAASDHLETPRSTAGERRTVPAIAFVVAVAVAAVLGVLAIAAAASGGSGPSDRDARVAAGRFAESFLSFRHDALDDWKETVLGLSTGGFANEVAEVESGLRQLIAQSRIDADATVTDIFVGEESRGAIDVVIVYDRAVATTDGTRTESDRYMQMSLVRVDGAWLVDSVIDIVSAGGLGTPAASTTTAPTTTTTAPAG